MRKRCLIFLLAVSLLLTGCSRLSDIKKKITGEGDSTPETSVKYEFDNSIVAYIDGTPLNYSEWFLYSEPVLSEAENMYGDSLYSYTVDKEGTTLYRSLMENTLENITYIRVICNRAESLGVSLNEDELIDVSLRSDEYLEKLSEEQRKEYGITEELVKKVYSDNMLARKVYEHLVLNVDTRVDMNLVRHMDLQYMVVSKSNIGEDETAIPLSGEELSLARAELQRVIDEYRSHDGIISLFDAAGSVSTYPVYELVTGKAELAEKLSGQISDAAFELPDRAVSELIETEDALYVLCCAEYLNENESNKARIAIIEQRQEELFSESYNSWRTEAEVAKNPELWEIILNKRE